MAIHVVHFMCGINPKTAQIFRDCCLDAINNGKADELIVHMSSLGGKLHDAFTLHNFLRSLPVETTITNVGSVDSSAVLFYLGARRRVVYPHCRFMFHPWTWTFGDGERHVHVIEEALHSLRADFNRFEELFKAATSAAKSPFDVRPTSNTAQSVDSLRAVEHGIAHEVNELKTPKGAILWWVNE